MGLFSSKKRNDDSLKEEVTAIESANQAFDAAFEDELRQMGRNHFKQLLEGSTMNLRPAVDDVLQRVAGDMRDYMRRQLDMTIARINSEITKQLSDRLAQFDSMASESRDAMVRSLNNDALDMREKYQQLSASLQQVVAQQEVLMVGVFQEHKTRLEEAQRKQDDLISKLTAASNSAQQQASLVESEIRQSIEQQKHALDAIYQENLTRVQETSNTQAAMLEKLTASANALDEKHQQMTQFLDQTVAKQKAMIAQSVGDNTARIVEHYVIGALGEQADVRTQLPGILQQMEQHKKDMMDDIAL